MRIANAQFSQQAIATISKQTESLQQLQQQVASGKRVNQASDDPIAAAEAERIRSASTEYAIERRMMSHASGMLSQADGALSSATDLLQSARDLLVAAGNGALQVEDRSLIATQLQGIRDELLAAANQRDGSGGFVFGGQGASTAPFSTAGAPAFLVDGGTQQTGLGMAFDTTVDGQRVFLGDGSTGTGGSTFAALDTIIGQIRDPALDNAAVRTALNTAITATDASLGRVSTARTEVGEQLRAIDSRTRLIESGELKAASRLSDLTATDYAAAISQMSQHELAVKAAMQSYVKIARISLFDYL